MHGHMNVKCALDSCQFLIETEFSLQIFEKKKFMKIRPVGAELFRAGGWTDRHYEANSRFSQFFEQV
jgi:hypothetical protein